MFKHCAVMSLLLPFSLLTAFAQTPDTATVRGVVSDQSHALVPDAHVHVTNTLSGLDRVTTSGKDGSFVIAGLPIAGDYDVAVTKQGFAEARKDHVTLAGGSTADISN